MNKTKFKNSVMGVFSKFKNRSYVHVFACIIAIAFVVIPLITMLAQINGETITNVFTDDTFYSSLLNSILTTLIATILSIVLAYSLAWSISRTNIKCKTLFSIILILPMLIPSISHGMGLVILFGNNGIFTRLFDAVSNLYGYNGIILGSVLYSFPVAFLMFVDILKYEDQTPYEAGDILGIPKHKQFTAITLPYLRKPLISIVFSVFTMIITDYGIPLAVGGKVKTLPVLLYENAVGQLNYSTGALIGVFLLIPAIIAFVVDLLNKDKGKSTFTTRQFVPRENKVKDTIGYIICSLTSLFVLMVIVSFCIQAFSNSYPSDMSFTWEHFQNTINKNGLTYLENSIFMSTPGT